MTINVNQFLNKKERLAKTMDSFIATLFSGDEVGKLNSSNCRKHIIQDGG